MQKFYVDKPDGDYEERIHRGSLYEEQLKQRDKALTLGNVENPVCEQNSNGGEPVP